MWRLPGDGSDRGDIVGMLKDDTVALVLATKPGPAFGDHMVLVLCDQKYGWVWEGELRDPG
jgi:hypothetical protein